MMIAKLLSILEKSIATTPELSQNALNEAVSALELLANTDNADPRMPAHARRDFFWRT